MGLYRGKSWMIMMVQAVRKTSTPCIGTEFGVAALICSDAVTYLL